MQQDIAPRCKRLRDGPQRSSTKPHTEHCPFWDSTSTMDWGLTRGAGSRSDALSAGCNRDEGYTGKLFREMMEQHKMYAASGHFRPLVGGRTDFNRLQLTPLSLTARSITKASVLFHSGRTLQQATVRRPLDHDPVLVRFAYAPDMFRPPQPEQVRLDIDLLGVAMKTDYRREIFLKKVEEGAKEAATRHPPHSTMADSKWEDFVQILQTAAGECYAQARTQKRTDRRITRNSSQPGKRLSD